MYQRIKTVNKCIPVSFLQCDDHNTYTFYEASGLPTPRDIPNTHGTDTLTPQMNVVITILVNFLDNSHVT